MGVNQKLLLTSLCGLIFCSNSALALRGTAGVSPKLTNQAKWEKDGYIFLGRPLIDNNTSVFERFVEFLQKEDRVYMGTNDCTVADFTNYKCTTSLTNQDNGSGKKEPFYVSATSSSSHTVSCSHDSHSMTGDLIESMTCNTFHGDSSSYEKLECFEWKGAIEKKGTRYTLKTTSDWKQIDKLHCLHSSKAEVLFKGLQ